MIFSEFKISRERLLQVVLQPLQRSHLQVLLLRVVHHLNLENDKVAKENTAPPHPIRM